jgi:urea transport system ATP-binding protein
MLAVRDVDLFYGAAQALRRVSISAEPGKITCILGRNGVGKTSLLRAIVGLQPIAAGSVSWLDREIAALPPHERARRGIGYVPQGREIFPLLTVRENLETGFAAAPQHVLEHGEQLEHFTGNAFGLPRRRGGDLSGGQQQQLAIGRALVMRPRLLVLDEPTEGIQPSIIKEIGRAIAYLRDRGGMAILLVEQYFEFARDLADRFAVMDRGEIVIAGERSEMDETTVRRHLTV